MIRDWRKILGQDGSPPNPGRPQRPGPRQSAPASQGLEVELSHVPNPDFRGGYPNGEPVDPPTPKRVPVSSIEEAARVCREYIDRNELGGGNWVSGKIFRDGVPIGHVSYNGRVWDMNEKPMDGSTSPLGWGRRGAARPRTAQEQGPFIVTLYEPDWFTVNRQTVQDIQAARQAAQGIANEQAGSFALIYAGNRALEAWLNVKGRGVTPVKPGEPGWPKPPMANALGASRRTAQAVPPRGAPPPSSSAPSAPDFEQWLMNLPNYSGDVVDVHEWTNPQRWPSPEAHHEAQEAADLFHAGNLEEAEREVYDAMQMANGAGRREGRRTMRGRTAAPARPQPQRRRAQMDDWSELTGDEGGGVPTELELGVTDVVDGADLGGDDTFGDLLEEPGEGKSPVDLKKKDLDLIRSSLEEKEKVVSDEDEKKAITGVLKKLKGIGNSVLTPTDDEDEDEAGFEAGDAEGGAEEAGEAAEDDIAMSDEELAEPLEDH